jgi:2-succinyl-6-hydroxy-2,4-cyclohexadiene-1-carboxylate synthase
MGARLALALAVHAPQRVSSLVLIGGSPGLPDENQRRERRERDRIWCQMLLDEGIEVFARRWQEQPLWRSQARLPAEVQQTQQEIRLAHDPRQLALALQVLGLAEMPDLWPQLPGLAIPMTLVTGQLDRKFTAIADAMAAKMPAARHLEVADTGHNVVLERPDLIRELVTIPDAKSAHERSKSPTPDRPARL